MNPEKPTKKVSDYLAEFLEAQGIKHAFGIIGSGNAHIFDSIGAHGFTEIVCVHHEQAAVMAAGIYSRITGKPGVVLVTTGAGSSNAVTGVVSTWMDSIPVVILSGNENSRFTSKDNPLRIWGIQGFDSSGMVSRVTKYSKRVLKPESIVKELEFAFKTAGESRPGPVWLDIPMNIQATPVAEESLWKRPIEATSMAPRRSRHGQGQGGRSVPKKESPLNMITQPAPAAKRVAAMLRDSKRPVLWLGNGIRFSRGPEGGPKIAQKLVDALGIPVLVSWQAIDLVDSKQPLVYGRAGIYGQRCANFVLQNSDALLTVGTRLAVPQVGYDLSEFARAAKIAVVDVDPTETAKHGEKINIPVCMDAGAFIDALIAEIGGDGIKGAYARPEWIKQCDLYRERFPRIGPEHKDPDGFINSYPFMARLEKFMHPDQVIVTDMGTALLSGHQVLEVKPPQRLMTSTGLGEMGFGISAAIGASFAQAPKLGRPGEVMCLNCDGGMMMNLQELQTIAHHKLPIKFIIFNNDGYLMIKHTQKALFKGRYTGTDVKSGVSCPDYSKLATAFGFPSYQIRTWEDMESVMPKVQADSGPVICEVFMHPEQFFHPKLSLAPQPDGSIISPPLEDLAPLLPREVLRENMVIGLHPKSEAIKV